MKIEHLPAIMRHGYPQVNADIANGEVKMSTKFGAISAATAQILFAVCSQSLPALADPLRQIMIELNEWIDANSNLPPATALARIRLANDDTQHEQQTSSMVIGLRTRGLYEPETTTITLLRPWNSVDLVDVSVLLHELVHHRQEGTYYHCLGAREFEAYKLQQSWLAEHALALDINWFAVVLESGCAPRDIHPD